MAISASQRLRHQNLLLFILKCFIMFAVISLFLFFLGFAAIILLHFLFVPKTQNNNQNKQLLPDMVYNESEFKDSPSSDTCSICLDMFMEGEVSWLLPDCKHLFHATCLHNWISKIPTCPICRTPVSFLRNYYDDHWKRLWTSTSTVNFHGQAVSSHYS